MEVKKIEIILHKTRQRGFRRAAAVINEWLEEEKIYLEIKNVNIEPKNEESVF